MADPEILPPSIDPETKKIGIRHVTATNAAGTRTRIQVRDFAPVYTDEPIPSVAPIPRPPRSRRCSWRSWAATG